MSAHINGQAPQTPQVRGGGRFRLGGPSQAPGAQRPVRDDFGRLCELFRSAGWDVEFATRAPHDALVFRFHEGEAQCAVQEVSRDLSNSSLEGSDEPPPRAISPAEDAKCTGVISPGGLRRRIGEAVTEEPSQEVIDEVLDELFAGLRPGRESVCVQIFEGPNNTVDAKGTTIPNPGIRSAWDTVRVFFAAGWNVYGRVQRISDGPCIGSNKSKIDLVFSTPSPSDLSAE